MFTLFALLSCSVKGRLDIHKPDKNADPGPFYKAVSTAACEQKGVDSCLELAEIPGIPDGYALVRIFQNPTVYEKVDLKDILPQDRKTLEAAALVTAAVLFPTLDRKARAAGYQLPSLNIDPLCAHSEAIHNGFFRTNYGTDKKSLTNIICVGKTFSQPLGREVPLALDPAIIAHEFYHALFALDFLADDQDQKILNVMFENHDLEALSEGLADHFAYTVKREFDPWFIKLLGLFYRDPQKRAELTQNHDFYTEIYQDGQRFTMLNNQLFDDGIDTLSLNRCLARGLKADISRALDYAEKNGIKWNRVVSLAEIKHNYEVCADAAQIKDKVTGAWIGLFPEPKEALASAADLSLVAISNQKALCSFSKSYGLNARSFQRYQYVSPCSAATSIVYKDSSLSFADAEQSAYPTNEPVWVTAGLKLVGGGAFDCRLRGPTALLSELALYADGAIERVGFTLPAPKSKKGSWYRDIPYGSFLAGDEDRYKIAGPLADLSAQGYRFTSQAALSQKPDPSSGLSGLLLLPSFAHTATDKEGKNKKIADRLRATFSLFYRDSESRRCAEGSPDCRPLLNFFIQCSSHRTPLSAENPLGSYKYLPVNSLKVNLYDCSGEDVCALKSY